jgi:protein disulfide-isomerase A1
MRVICILLTYVIVKAVIEEENGVIILTEDNFDEAIDTFHPLIVEFYAPWCQHCQKLAPEYSKAAYVLRNENPPIHLAKVDATENRSLASRFSLSGYPTITLFRGPKELINFNGERTEGGIVNWVRKLEGRIVRQLTAAAEVENFISVNQVAIVLFDQPDDVLERIASERIGISFASCSSYECLSRWNVNRGTVVLFKKFDEGRNDFTGPITFGEFGDFIDSYSSPLTQSWTEKTNDLVVNKKNPALFLFRSTDSYNFIHLDEMLKNVSRRLKGKLLVITTDIAESSSKLAEHFGISNNDLPVVCIYDTRAEPKRYKLKDTNLNEDNIMKFIEQWEKGELKQSLKSEEIPAREEEASLNIVGKNFWDVILDNKRDVLVLFYAPWCQHSQQFARIYEDFADEIEDFEFVVLAKIDITSNDIDGINITTYPQLRLWPAFSKDKPVNFEESRDRQGLIEFLQKYSFNKIYINDDL